MKWYWWLIIIVVILAIAGYFYNKQNNNIIVDTLTGRQKPVTSCPKGYTLNKGHCVCTNPPCGLLPPSID